MEFVGDTRVSDISMNNRASFYVRLEIYFSAVSQIVSEVYLKIGVGDFHQKFVGKFTLSAILMRNKP
jgi:hypothetical protein